MDLDLIRKLTVPSESKIVFLVMDGLGGLPREPGGLTELETARTPNLDALASRSVCGCTVPVGPGITPGSGPGHLALFGYDPLHFVIGRGVLEAVGIDLDLGPDDVAGRGNFCTIDNQGRVCLLYTSDAADDLLCVDLGGRRTIKKKKQKQPTPHSFQPPCHTFCTQK